MKKIERVCFEVCGSCQNTCVFCIHGGMLAAYPDYQLTIAEVKKFIDSTKSSGYFFETILIHGIGEPLLWDHFDEGIELIKNSGIGGKINVITNGLLLDRIKDQTWKNIDLMHVSVYPNYPRHRLLKEKKETYKEKIQIELCTRFTAKPLWRYWNKIPCRCGCYGLMFVKDKIFLYCGPPVFEAAKLCHVDIFKCSDLYAEVKPNYLEKFDETKVGNMKLCNYCWSNTRIILPSYPHGYVPTKLERVLASFFLDGYKQLTDFLKKMRPGYNRFKKNKFPI